MTFQDGFTPAGNTGIGLDLHKTPAGTDKIGIHCCNLHIYSPLLSLHSAGCVTGSQGCDLCNTHEVIIVLN